MEVKVKVGPTAKFIKAQKAVVSRNEKVVKMLAALSLTGTVDNPELKKLLEAIDKKQGDMVDDCKFILDRARQAMEFHTEKANEHNVELALIENFYSTIVARLLTARQGKWKHSKKSTFQLELQPAKHVLVFKPKKKNFRVSK